MSIKKIKSSETVPFDNKLDPNERLRLKNKIDKLLKTPVLENKKEG